MTRAASLPFDTGPAHAGAGPHDDAEPPDLGEPVTITRVFNPLEAEILRGCLESEGIPVTLGDACTIQNDTLLTGALGGIRVMVPAACAEAARLAVAALARGEFAIDELPPGADPAPPEPDTASQAGLPRLSLLAIVLLAVIGLIVALSPHVLMR